MVWDAKQVDDIVFYIVLGVVLGGRIGYILFYNFSEFLANPLVLIKVWNGGMSFHGGLLGVLLAMWYFARKHGRTFYEATDFIAPLVTIGLGAGRIGNFINAELWGGVTDLPWGMRVPCSVGEALCARLGLPMDAEYSLPVHPSQLYESFLEGLVLFPDPMDLLGQAKTEDGGFRTVFGLLWDISIHGRIRAHARPAYRLSCL